MLRELEEGYDCKLVHKGGPDRLNAREARELKMMMRRYYKFFWAEIGFKHLKDDKIRKKNN